MFRSLRPTARTTGALYLRLGNDRERILQTYNNEAPVKDDEKGGSEVIGNNVRLIVYFDQRFSICLELSRIASSDV